MITWKHFKSVSRASFRSHVTWHSQLRVRKGRHRRHIVNFNVAGSHVTKFGHFCWLVTWLRFNVDKVAKADFRSITTEESLEIAKIVFDRIKIETLNPAKPFYLVRDQIKSDSFRFIVHFHDFVASFVWIITHCYEYHHYITIYLQIYIHRLTINHNHTITFIVNSIKSLISSKLVSWKLIIRSAWPYHTNNHCKSSCQSDIVHWYNINRSFVRQSLNFKLSVVRMSWNVVDWIDRIVWIDWTRWMIHLRLMFVICIVITVKSRFYMV